MQGFRETGRGALPSALKQSSEHFMFPEGSAAKSPGFAEGHLTPKVDQDYTYWSGRVASSRWGGEPPGRAREVGRCGLAFIPLYSRISGPIFRPETGGVRRKTSSAG